VALDIQAGMHDRARKKAHTAGLSNIPFVQAGVGEDKLGHNQFDRALLVTNVAGRNPGSERCITRNICGFKT
jgi:ubiquinone/menaquinone biosynthesis C-methylase UbiE